MSFHNCESDQFVRFPEMAKNILILVAVFAVIFGFANSASLPDCDDFISDAPLLVDEIHEACHKECSSAETEKKKECFKNCVVKKVEDQGEDGEYVKFIISNLAEKKTEAWKQELADILKEKCLPILTEQKKIAEAFECYMETKNGKCVDTA